MNAKKTILLLMVLTLTTALITIVGSLTSLNEELTSFPWWSVFVFAGYHFGPALILEGIAYGVVHWLEKRKK